MPLQPVGEPTTEDYLRIKELAKAANIPTADLSFMQPTLTDTWVFDKEKLIVNPKEPVILQPKITDMQELKQALEFSKNITEKFTEAISPELKKQVCEIAKEFAHLCIPAKWLPFVLAAIQALENTIQTV